MDIILIGAIALLVGGLFGYTIGARSPTSGFVPVVRSLCGVIEQQSKSISKSQQRSLDAAFVTQEQQLERVAAEYFIERDVEATSAREASSGKNTNYMDAHSYDPGITEESISTEYP
jgi:hypothetical protein